MARNSRRGAHAAPDVEDLARQIKQIQNDFAELAETIKAIGMNRMDGATEAFSEAVEQAAGNVRSSAAEARHRGEAIAGDVEAVITRNPFTAILVAFGLGYVIARMKRR